MYTSDDVPFLDTVRGALSDELRQQIETASSGDRVIELSPRGVTKGSAVAALASRLEIPMSEVIAIGDNLNDVTILQAAGLGLAVRNADPDAMMAADMVSVYTNDADAVARILETIVLKDA